VGSGQSPGWGLGGKAPLTAYASSSRLAGITGKATIPDGKARSQHGPGAGPADQSLLVLVAPFPPPVHGAALVADQLHAALAQRCRVVRADVSARRLAAGPLRHLTRLAGYAGALVCLVRQAGHHRRHLCVLTAGGPGNLYNALCLATGRLLGYRLFIDHQAFSYLDRYDPVFALLVRLAGSHAVHFVRCRRMARRLERLYRGVGPIEIVPNLGPPPAPEPASTVGRPLVLGHLGNLGHDKGLDVVLAVARRAHDEGLAVRLVLAGPAQPADLALIIGVTEGGVNGADLEGVEYRGALYGDDKRRFFGEIDVFLFPTRYRPEAQPLVLLEAEAHGVPVIATGRGCIAEDFSAGSDPAGPNLIVPPECDFVAVALGRLRHWTANPSALATARRAAWQAAGVRRAVALDAQAHMIARLADERNFVTRPDR